MLLGSEDRYALARAFAGLPPNPAVVVTPIVGLFVRNWEGRRPGAEDVELARKFFGQELITQVFAVDPNGAAPVADDFIEVPGLPEAVKLDEQKLAAAQKVGGWMNVWMKYAKRQAGMTDDLFLESGGLWLIGLACARRVALRLDFQTIYPNFYSLWVAPTTYYRKSTGLRVVERIARDNLGHLLLAGQSSPEMLLFKLAGQRTTNYDDLDEEEQAREEQGRQYAGQRGFIADEMSKLFGKKYMEGLPEILMEMAEAPRLVEHEYRGMGKLVVKNAGLSLLFATTPARLQRVFGDGEWEDGLLPRFALLTPGTGEVKATPAKRMAENHQPDAVITDALRVLVNQLPQPKVLGALGDPKSIHAIASVAAHIEDAALDAFNLYFDALHQMTAPSSGLDYRLAGVYGRLPVHGLRVAVALAAIDWAVKGGEGTITITPAHWWRAQNTVEDWRASSHRLLAQVNRSQDQVVEDQIMGVLRMHHPKPPSKHEIYKRAKIGVRAAAFSAIDALQEAGLIALVESGGRTGYILSGG
jgi:hypothetical protein